MSDSGTVRDAIIAACERADAAEGTEGMRMTTEIDIEQFNEAAQALYDVAYQRGVKHGREEALIKQAQQHALGLLEVAERVLDNLEPVELLSDSDLKWRMAIARMILGRTPMVVPEVTRALDCLHYRALIEPTVEEATKSLKFIRDGLKKVNARVWIGDDPER